MILTWVIISALWLVFMGGVCLGAAAVEIDEGELCLPAGWWLLPTLVFSAAVLLGILAAVVL